MQKERKTRIRKNEKVIAGETYWNACKAAEYLGVAKGTILSLCKRNLISNLQHGAGSTYFFQPQWLSDYINEKTKKINTYKSKEAKR